MEEPILFIITFCQAFLLWPLTGCMFGMSTYAFNNQKEPYVGCRLLTAFIYIILIAILYITEISLLIVQAFTARELVAFAIVQVFMVCFTTIPLILMGSGIIYNYVCYRQAVAEERKEKDKTEEFLRQDNENRDHANYTNRNRYQLRNKLLEVFSFNISVFDQHLKCMLCQSNLQSGKQGIRFGCTHIYDKDCMSQWLLGNSNCPTCNSNLKLQLEEMDIPVDR